MTIDIYGIEKWGKGFFEILENGNEAQGQGHEGLIQTHHSRGVECRHQVEAA